MLLSEVVFVRGRCAVDRHVHCDVGGSCRISRFFAPARVNNQVFPTCAKETVPKIQANEIWERIFESEWRTAAPEFQ